MNLKLAIHCETNIPDLKALLPDVIEADCPDGKLADMLAAMTAGLGDGTVLTVVTVTQDEYDPALFRVDAHNDNGSRWFRARVKVVG